MHVPFHRSAGALVVAGFLSCTTAAAFAQPLPIRTLTGHTDTINSLVFAADGQTLLSSSDDKTVRLWDVPGGQLKRTLTPGPAVADATFWSNSQTVAITEFPKVIVKLWDTSTGAMKQAWTGPALGWPVAYATDATSLASASKGLKASGDITLYDVRTHAALHVLKGHTGDVKALSFAPDGMTLASAGNDKTVKLWDTHTGQLKQTMIGHGGVVSVAFSPDGKDLASACTNTNVKLWNSQTGALSHLMEGHRNIVMAVAFSPDGKTLASGSLDGTVRLWDVPTGTLQHIVKADTAVMAVAFNPAGTLLASAGGDKVIKLWDVSQLKSQALEPPVRKEGGP